MNVIKRTRKLIGKWILIPFTNYYLSKEREVIVGTIHLKIPTGVFHPTLFYSTKLFLNYLTNIQVAGLTILELGAGSGLLSIATAKRGALITSSDISELACNTVQKNALLNNVTVKIIHSDLFNGFSKQFFDLVLINPPYYPKNPETDAERAWFCGSNFDYYYNLFYQLKSFLKESSYALMILSEDCNIEKISKIALDNNYCWTQVYKNKHRGEWNYIFKIAIQQ